MKLRQRLLFEIPKPISFCSAISLKKLEFNWKYTDLWTRIVKKKLSFLKRFWKMLEKHATSGLENEQDQYAI